ncbi:hypothetical protein L211DRAFT_649794 [Terfezia boudieri ATCC MYA-4762]|uniref:Uncharacterized protein n=1 Tax=Terfezia boudieri ATCC MYA-4762 TaxID=1051890 RepID=A0A3N4LYH7_9PEZI|nr:hypothetical protein L211DRAFT_649794 [Terfezia boudieri ATCC MYA-4762]
MMLLHDGHTENCWVSRGFLLVFMYSSSLFEFMTRRLHCIIVRFKWTYLTAVNLVNGLIAIALLMDSSSCDHTCHLFIVQGNLPLIMPATILGAPVAQGYQVLPEASAQKTSRQV